MKHLHIRTGIDLMRVSRIEAAFRTYGERFVSRIYTAHEQQICGDRVHALAGRWAAKEAVSKLLGTGFHGLGSGEHAISWKSVEISRDDLSKPIVQLYDHAQVVASQLHIKQIDISISHDGEYVIASAVALCYNGEEE